MSFFEWVKDSVKSRCCHWPRKEEWTLKGDTTHHNNQHWLNVISIDWMAVGSVYCYPVLQNFPIVHEGASHGSSSMHPRYGWVSCTLGTTVYLDTCWKRPMVVKYFQQNNQCNQQWAVQGVLRDVRLKQDHPIAGSGWRAEHQFPSAFFMADLSECLAYCGQWLWGQNTVPVLDRIGY